ncbi:PPW family C-terminal domain-containing PPE protein [Candidatus Mycobacterium wuenschmannii]
MNARAQEPTPDKTAAPAAAPAAAAAAQKSAVRRRRRASMIERGRGTEYMDLTGDLEPTIIASDVGASNLGFAGTVSAGRVGAAVGLTTLSDNDFGDGPTMPMMPSTWGATAAEA